MYFLGIFFILSDILTLGSPSSLEGMKLLSHYRRGIEFNCTVTCDEDAGILSQVDVKRASSKIRKHIFESFQNFEKWPNLDQYWAKMAIFEFLPKTKLFKTP